MTRIDSSKKFYFCVLYFVFCIYQSVSSAWLDPESATSLESGSMGDWNQFEANSRLFNVKHTYDENIYTKKLDLNKFSKAQILKAERIAREIESGSSDNIHIQQERGHRMEMEMDEEDMFSGVLRDQGGRPSGGPGPGQGPDRGMGGGFQGKGKGQRMPPMQQNVRYAILHCTY